jgi:hypothetical protein
MRLVTVDLKNHALSQIRIDEYRLATSHVGQAVTCRVCNPADHMAQECPKEEPGRKK